MIQLRPLTATVAGFACLSLLAGCSNEETPPAAEMPSTATSAATSTEHPAASADETEPVDVGAAPPAPVLDEVATTFTVDGASSFASYFVQVLNHDRAAGDPSLLRSISDVECAGCRFHADVIDEYRSRGYSSPGFTLQFTGTRVDSWDPQSGEIGLTVDISRPAFQTIDDEGLPIGAATANPSTEFWIDLNWEHDRWVVWEVE